jgi:hypothetical protein
MCGGDGTPSPLRFLLCIRVLEPLPNHTQSDRAVIYEVAEVTSALVAESAVFDVSWTAEF